MDLVRAENEPEGLHVDRVDEMRLDPGVIPPGNLDEDGNAYNDDLDGDYSAGHDTGPPPIWRLMVGAGRI